MVDSLRGDPILVFLWYRECPECGVCGGHDGDCTRDSACPGRGLCGDSPPFRGTSLTGLRQLSNAKLDYTPLGRDGAAQEDKKEPTPPSAAKVARRRRRRRRLAEARAAGRAGPPAAGGGSGDMDEEDDSWADGGRPAPPPAADPPPGRAGRARWPLREKPHALLH